MSPNVARIVRAVDAIEDGDPELATELFEQTIDATTGRFQCACGRRFEFPGQLDDHEASGLCWKARHAA